MPRFCRICTLLRGCLSSHAFRNVPIDAHRPARSGDHRRRPIRPPRRVGRRRRGTGHPAGRGGGRRPRRCRTRNPAQVGRLDPRRQSVVVALREPGLGSRPPPRCRGRRACLHHRWGELTAGPRQPHGARHRRRSCRSCRARRRRGVAHTDARPAVGDDRRLGEGTRDGDPGDDRRRARHDPSRRGSSRHLPPGAGVSAVRVGDQGGGPNTTRRARGRDRRAVVALQRRRRNQSPCLDASADVRRGDRHGDPAEPHRRVAVPQGDERQQRRRHGGGAHHVLGRAGGRPPRPTRSLGVPPRRDRLPRAPLRVASVVVHRDAGHPHRRTAGAPAGGRRDR